MSTTSILSHHPTATTTANNLKRVAIYPSKSSFNPFNPTLTSVNLAGKTSKETIFSNGCSHYTGLVAKPTSKSLRPMQMLASLTGNNNVTRVNTYELGSKPVTTLLRKSLRPITRIQVSSPTNKPTTINQKPTSKTSQETIFFDGGAHYGDLIANLILGFTLLWLPLTLAAVSRAFFLRYRFTNLRVTVISGFTGQDRSDFSYKVIKDVQVVPRFIGEWGDIVITLKDGTVVDLRSVPKFREIAKYCLSMTENKSNPGVVNEIGSKGF